MDEETSLQCAPTEGREQTRLLSIGTTSAPAAGALPPPCFVDVLRSMPPNGVLVDRVTSALDSANYLGKNNHRQFSSVSDADSTSTKHPDSPDVMLVFGITSVGHRVIIHVTDYLPYTFHPVPSWFSFEDILDLMNRTNARVGFNAVHCIDLLEAEMYPSQRPIQILKITATGARSLEKIRDKLFSIFHPYILHLTWVSHVLCSGGLRFDDYYFTKEDRNVESSIDDIFSFVHDCELKAMFGVLIRAGMYHELPAEQKVSGSQLEYITRQADTAWRIFSFSIKTTLAENNPLLSYRQHAVIQIAVMAARKGEPDPYLRVVFTLGTCSAIDGAEVHEYSDETSLLLGWKEFLNNTDPDVVTGYGEATVPVSFNRSWKDTPMLPGRLVFDVCKHLEKNVMEKLRRAGADAFDVRRAALAMKYLREFDEANVDGGLHSELQAGAPDDRRRLAVSCLKDAYTPHLLLNCPILQLMEEVAQAARAENVPFNFYATNGPELPRMRRFSSGGHGGVEPRGSTQPRLPYQRGQFIPCVAQARYFVQRVQRLAQPARRGAPHRAAHRRDHRGGALHRRAPFSKAQYGNAGMHKELGAIIQVQGIPSMEASLRWVLEFRAEAGGRGESREGLNSYSDRMGAFRAQGNNHIRAMSPRSYARGFEYEVRRALSGVWCKQFRCCAGSEWFKDWQGRLVSGLATLARGVGSATQAAVHSEKLKPKLSFEY
ncbi:ribonuclease H-like domain-containing protein [Mycena rosella]|uniref:DNA polymerase delta catalytic subunit n=1 Tax=Mycena rosella TaxID=1033263 RepID=A0AAD7DZI8_MYCRO|nr:ribonuclease H-like domain-containing protein [Mycena rosella]